MTAPTNEDLRREIQQQQIEDELRKAEQKRTTSSGTRLLPFTRLTFAPCVLRG